MRKLVIMLISVMLLGLASAAITLNDPASTYNLGDKLYVSASGIVGADSGNLNIDLVCGTTKVNLVKISARSFDSTGEQTYSIPYKILSKGDLEIEDFSKILGSCKVLANLNGQSVSTKDFVITDDIGVFANLDSTDYNPGENIQLTIKANRADGTLFNGFFQITGSTEISGVIKDGISTQVFSMLETTSAGVYDLNLVVYDTDNDGRLNQGEIPIKFIINQVPTSITSSISNVEVTPKEELTFGAEVLDQTSEKIKGSVSLQIISPKSSNSKESNLEFAA